MSWVADQVGMQDQAKAHSEAYLKSVYGDGINFPEPHRNLAGGAIDNGQHIDLGRLLDRGKRPKSGPWPWLFGIVLVLALTTLGGFALWWTFHPPTKAVPQGVQVPGGYNWEARPFNPFAS